MLSPPDGGRHHTAPPRSSPALGIELEEYAREEFLDGALLLGVEARDLYCPRSPCGAGAGAIGRVAEPGKWVGGNESAFVNQEGARVAAPGRSPVGTAFPQP